MKVKIVTDSSADIHEFEGMDFSSVPFAINAGDREFIDDENMDVADMAMYLRSYNGKSSTACPGVGDYLAAYEGYDMIFALTISGNLSGSYNSAKVAADEYMEKYPERKVHVFNSLSTGPELVMLAEKIRECVDKGCEFEEVVAIVNEYHDNIRTIFALESIHNLVNNGRVPSVVEKVVGVLNMRLIGVASDQGTIQTSGKARGQKKVAPELVKCMLKYGYKGAKVYITHCFNEQTAIDYKNAILAQFPDAEIKISTMGGLCSFYAEYGGLIACFEH